MGHSKVSFLILTQAFWIASTAFAVDPDEAEYRYLRPLSTNVSPDDVQDFDEPEFNIAKDTIYKEREESDEDDDNKDFEHLLKHPKAAMDHLRDSKRKMAEIEREIQKRRQDKEKELKKFLAEIDREHKKHIVEIERERRKLLQELEREYRENLRKSD